MQTTLVVELTDPDGSRLGQAVHPNVHPWFHPRMATLFGPVVQQLTDLGWTANVWF